MAVIYWGSDGVGEDVGSVHTAFIKWIRQQGNADLIINGGDVYGDGTPEEFQMYRNQMLGDMRDICEIPGNHDWKTRATSASTGQIPSGYEAFWQMFPPPSSRQPIDVMKKGGARYEHFIDLAGWRLIFLDTGPCEDIQPWPMGDSSRVTWLRQALDTPGRAKIVCAHHSRLSRGKHGDIVEVDAVWQALFTDTGAPRVAMTLGGHDHNVSVYAARTRQPSTPAVAPAEGIHVVVNGAGGRGHDIGFQGTEPELFFEEDQYCLTRITLIDERSADVDFLGFGRKKDPPANPTPVLLHKLPIRV
jgi:3',5'-cyclic AMP phosphodiesterase CpdA